MGAVARLLCFYCCLLGCLWESAHGDAVRLTREIIENAWQSSSYTNSEHYCFTQSADRIGQWDYMHTGETPDSDYQWLLVQLRRPTRLRSVTLMGRSEVVQRAVEVEVRLAAELPGGFLDASSAGRGCSCCGTLAHSHVSSLASCGRSGGGSAAKLQCSSAQCDGLTRYILLRKYVAHLSDKIMNLKYIEIDEDSPTALTRPGMLKAWQSSSWQYGSRSSCFWQGSPSSADFFHSGSWATADAGFHWFLVQLKQPALIWQVMIQSPSGSEEARGAAAGVQVYYSGTLPAELAQKDSCRSEWMANFRPSDFSLCGTTPESGLTDGAQLVVSCCSVSPTMRAAVILLRKPSNSHANMSFVSMHIKTTEAAQFLICSDEDAGDCGEGKLRLLSVGKTVTVHVKVPCTLQSGHVTMEVKLVNATVVRASSTHEYHSLSSTEYSFALTGHLWMHGATLKSGYRCSDGAYQALESTLEFVVPAQSVNLTLSNARHWLVDETAEFTLVTDFALPRPTHSCQMIDSLGYPHALSPASETRQERPLAVGSASYVSLRSVFRLTVAGSYENGSVHCVSRLQGTAAAVTRRQAAPRFFFPCKTRFVLPPPSRWQEGATLNVTVDSSDGNQLATSHTCLLLSPGRQNESLQQISTTNASCTFSLTVTREWGSSASILCRANQSGLIETWSRQLLPTVLFAASINLTAKATLTEPWPAEFNVSVTDGQPLPAVACTVHWDGGNLSVPLSPTLTGRFAPNRAMHNGTLVCRLTQRIESEIVYSASVSTILNVQYKANSSWTATDTLIVMENETASVTITSIGGNPPASHLCEVRLANMTVIQLLENRTLLSDSPVETKFSFVLSRQFDQGTLVCAADQGDERLVQRFQQPWTVYYPATLGLVVPDVVDEGSQVQFSLSVSIGQPLPVAKCSLAWSSKSMELPLPELVPSYNLTGNFSVVRDMHSGVLSCEVEQSNGTHAIFFAFDSRNLTVHFTSRNSWTVERSLTLKEGEPLTVAVTSAEGNPEPSQLCWLETASESKLQLKPLRQRSNGTQLISRFATHLVRRFNAGQLKCSVSQPGRPDFARNFSQSVAVFFPASTLSWSGHLINGTELQLTVLTDEGNPLPQLDCSLKSETVSIEKLTQFPEATVLGENSGWSRRVRLHQRFMEPQREVTVSCLVSQFQEPGNRIFGPAKNIKVLRADYSVKPPTTTALPTTSATDTSSTEFAPKTRPDAFTESTTLGAASEASGMPPSNGSRAPAGTATLAPAPAGKCLNCGKPRQAAGALAGLGLAALAVAFSLALAAGTYRCLSRSDRRVELVALPMRVVRRPRPAPPQCRQQQRQRRQQDSTELQERARNSTPNHYDVVI